MIELRIERLSPEEQRALEVASILRKFSLSVTVGSAVANWTWRGLLTWLVILPNRADPEEVLGGPN